MKLYKHSCNSNFYAKFIWNRIVNRPIWNNLPDFVMTAPLIATSRARPPGIPVREFPGICLHKIPGGNSREFMHIASLIFFFWICTLQDCNSNGPAILIVIVFFTAVAKSF